MTDVVNLDIFSLSEITVFCALVFFVFFNADVISSGKSPLLHALASADGLTVLNTDSIEVLLKRGAERKKKITVMLLFLP